MNDDTRRVRMTLHEAADRLGVHYMTAYRYVRTGRLDAVKVGAQWEVDIDAVEDLAARPPAPAGRGGVDPGPYRDRLEGRMIAGDESGAWRVVEEALTAGLEPRDVLTRLLAPALSDIGDRWAAGALTVADEHLASAVAQRVIGRLGPRFARRGRKRGTVVLGCPAGERHALPVAIVADLLRAAGYRVVDLGADTPDESFVDAARDADRLVAVGICVTSPGSATSAAGTVAALRAAGYDSVYVGGGGLDSEAEAVAAGSAAFTPDVDALLAALANGEGAP